MTHPIPRIGHIAGGHALPRLLLLVADPIADVPRPAAEVAAEVGPDADSLARVLPVLSAHGVFESQGTSILEGVPT